MIMPTVYGSICLLGVIGNGLVLYTVARKTTLHCKHTAADIFMFSLSLVDLLFLLGMPFLIHQLVGNGTWYFGETMCRIIAGINASSQITSAYILTAMTGPLPGLGRGGWSVVPLPPHHHPSDIYWYTLYQFFLAFAIPLVVICVVYIKILRYMVAAVAPLQYSNLEGRTKKVTRMAIAICTTFFICCAPFYFLQLANLGVTSSPFEMAYMVAIRLSYANSCITPFIYILLSKTFKRKIGVAFNPSKGKVPSTQLIPAEDNRPMMALSQSSARHADL
ncbi:melanin-concentrating hormone receptor 1-like [Acipenser oxyrinchus oxyrinchus]|uniref:Melanin-concentrating hormone receptor 1-like n=1 Tax=Acipenser oxyrinchus oxyrinchus TaxID=40147 RepID=A0AAD8D4T2_ACIOX|nr:melanin-concentrating hormone receptor 1-like [Acipenser oxyrinchus oxyrinchus]